MKSKIQQGMMMIMIYFSVCGEFYPVGFVGAGASSALLSYVILTAREPGKI